MTTDKIEAFQDHSLCPLCDNKAVFAFSSFGEFNEYPVIRKVKCMNCGGEFFECMETVRIVKLCDI